MCQRTRGLTIEEARRGCSGGGAAKRTWRLEFRCDGGSFVVVVVSLKTEEVRRGGGVMRRMMMMFRFTLRFLVLVLV